MLLAGHPENVRGTCCRPQAVLRARAVSEDSAESAVLLLLSGLVSNAVPHLGSSEDGPGARRTGHAAHPALGTRPYWRAERRTAGSETLVPGAWVGCSRGRVGWSPRGCGSNRMSSRIRSMPTVVTFSLPVTSLLPGWARAR